MTSPREVVTNHLEAVRALDAARMAADYAPDAVLVRGTDRHTGRDAIAAYFAEVPRRLSGGHVEADIVAVHGPRVEVRWRIIGGPGDAMSGRDHLRVRDGEIIEQTVDFDGEDF